MREAIRKAAEANKRSMNSEIVARLAESLDEVEGPASADDIRFLTRTLEKRIAEFQALLVQVPNFGKPSE